MDRSTATFFALVIGAALAAVPTAAWQPGPITDSGGVRPTPEQIRETEPELFYLKDDGGRLVPVPGFRYRDFVELFRLREGLAGPDQPPAAIFERVVVRIDARNPAASEKAWPATVECSILQSRGGWVMVPLGLRGLLLDQPPTHDGPGRMVVDTDAEGGLRCWFELPARPEGVAAAAAEIRQTVHLTGRVAVDVSAAQDMFDLGLPPAVTSRLEVLTNRPAPAVSLLPRTAGHVEIAPDEDGGLVTVTGVLSDIHVRITDSIDNSGPAASAQVECDSVVRIAGRSAMIQATLQLAGIPPGTSRLRLTPPPGITIRSVGGDAALLDTGEAAERPFLDVAVTAAADGRAMITLEGEGPVDPTGAAPLEPLGFAVNGIEPWRQWGRTSLIVDEEWQANWDDAPGLRRVDPPVSQRERGFVAAFAYDAQPAELAVRIRPRRSRVVIEPEYRYDVSASRITLDARLRVAARGAPVNGISLGLEPSWSLQDVGPAGLVDASALRVEGGLVTVPFLQPLAGDALVEITAARRIEPAAETIAWDFPTPKADLVGPAAVVIAADSDIELSPDSEASLGLVRQTASAIPMADAGRIALVYRLDAAEGRFVAARRFLPRRIEATVDASVAVDDQRVAVEESIRLNVMHVPLEFFELTVPEAAIATGSFEIRQGPELLDAVEMNRVPDAEGTGMPLVFLRALLPVPLLGEGEVMVRYRMPVPAIPRESTVALDLPLSLPAATGLSRQSVLLTDAGGLTVGVRGEAWRRDVTGRTAAVRSWSAPKPQFVLPLALTERVREVTSGTVVEATWLQTRLYPQSREDIVTYVISGATDPLTIDLNPDEATASACDVRVDGRPVAVEWQGPGRIVIDLDDELADSVDARRLVEIRTTAPWGGTAAGLGLPWPVPLDPPGLPQSVRERRFSWDVLAATDDHLFGGPARWTRQQRWTWSGRSWQEEAIVSAEELADWVRQDLPAGKGDIRLLATDSPPDGYRCVYSGVGRPGRAVLWVVPTWAIVLLASGSVLAFGLAALARPGWRRPGVLLGVAIAVFLAAAAAPGFAPLVGQAALPGVLLSIVAAGLHWFGNRQRTDRTAAAVTGGSASSLTRTAAPTVSLVVAPSAASAAVGTGRDYGPARGSGTERDAGIERGLR